MEVLLIGSLAMVFSIVGVIAVLIHQEINFKSQGK